MSEAEEYTDSADEWEAPPQAPLVDGDNDAAGQSKAKHSVLGQMGGEELELAGELVEIVFHMPNGSEVRRSHFMGQTVSYLKAQLDDVDGLPYERTTLFLKDRQLLDPLSLEDLPFVANEENHVTVRLAE
ncbi:hypothetical protein ERJ75_001645000 [Trypanosoma vivax]|uniref:Ubiquitin-like domain-containing protein n=1 Tax=Trypanosoma vivax (strain Y486) TaxID=1055687 RepID=G0U984_TRYVY|nr:hypothetical protein TRVL_04841 [Trypanosoma vivax]KAH8605014.1 hypothetical protein ERJ75_001645000 [Trypanosoma vivax]CCC54168.1 conserved hypothetical protein [Trypanosoma vivax Y486]